MGACASQMKEMAGSIDKEAVQMAVKSRRVEISNAAHAQAAEWTQKIDAGQSVTLSPMEVLPLKDTSAIKLTLDATSTPQQRLQTALYVVTNTLRRDEFKKNAQTELEAGMKSKKMPNALITNSAKVSGPMIDLALDQQIKAMAAAAGKGEPLVSAEETAAVQTYAAKHAPLAAAPLAAAPLPAEHKEGDVKPLDSKDIKLEEQVVSGRIGGSDKDSSALQGQTLEGSAPVQSWEKPVDNSLAPMQQSNQVAMQA